MLMIPTPSDIMRIQREEICKAMDKAFKNPETFNSEAIYEEGIINTNTRLSIFNGRRYLVYERKTWEDSVEWGWLELEHLYNDLPRVCWDDYYDVLDSWGKDNISNERSNSRVFPFRKRLEQVD